MLVSDSTNPQARKPLTPAEIAAKKAALPRRPWEQPADLRKIVDADSDVLRMGAHAWSNVLVPPPGIPLKANGIDAVKGRGQHHSAKQYLDDLDEWLDRWELQGQSAVNKVPRGETRWEVFTRISPELWLLTVIAIKNEVREHYIHTAYLFNDQSVQARFKLGFLRRRKEE